MKTYSIKPKIKVALVAIFLGVAIFTQKAASFEIGDVSCDGMVSISDAALAARAAVNLLSLSPEQLIGADMDNSGSVTICDAALIAQYAVGLYSPYSMQIESVDSSSNQIAVTTTGAVYKLSNTGMEMSRRIDPAKNAISPRQVARLDFSTDLGPLVISYKDKQKAVIESDKATFEFNSDSLFTITAKSSLAFTHTNLIDNPPWAKGSGLDRMWTDGYGGSLHAFWQGLPRSPANDANSTNIEMSSGDAMAGMVFPPKRFDFKKLYGQTARPFVQFVYSQEEMRSIQNNVQNYINAGFGVFVIWNSFYDQEPSKGYIPIKLDQGTLGYRIKDGDLVKNFIKFSHDNGFKVIAYFYGPAAREWRTAYKTYGSSIGSVYQDVDITLDFMDKFQKQFCTDGSKQYCLDGWYFDNADAGSLKEDYYFINKVRKQVGEGGVIFHHDSLDVWDNNRGWDLEKGIKYSGIKAVMIDAHVDHTLTGETGVTLADTHSPDHSYLRYYCSGYGLSQAYASEIILTNGKAAMNEEEKYRVIGQNLNGSERNLSEIWRTHFKPYYDQRKQDYLSGNFNPDVDWPPKWFKTPESIPLPVVTDNSVNISWDTEEDSTGEITYTSNGIWKQTQYVSTGPDGMQHQARGLSKHHSITLANLEGDTDYQIKIRSSNLSDGANESIYGYMGSFRTSQAIVEPPNPIQTLQGCDSDCENKLLAFWKLSSEGYDDLSGDHSLTYYGPKFNGNDSFEFNQDYKDRVDIKAGSKTLTDISVYGGENGSSTVMAWVKVINANKYNVLSQHIGGFDYFSVGTSDGNNPVLRTMVYDKTSNKNYWPTSSIPIANNQWTHVAFVFEAGKGYRFYINGALDPWKDPKAIPANLSLHNYPSTANLAYLGYGFGETSYFDGNIRDFAVFNGALTDAQIYNIYLGGLK